MVSKETIGKRAPDERALRSLVFVIGLMMVVTVMTTISFSSDVSADEIPLTDLTDDPVAIDGDLALAASGIDGTGSWDDPFVIEGLGINATGYANAIKISNTVSHLIIRDCNLSYANGGGYEDRSGLRLVNVNNVIVENVTAYMNAYNGIKLDECDNITIIGCRLIDNGIAAPSSDSNGIKITGCVDLSIEDCTIIGNERVGLYFTSEFSRDCVNISLRDSNISGSMWDIWTYSNKIYGFAIENCTFSDFSVAGFWMRDETNHPKQTDWIIRNVTIDNDNTVQTNAGIYLSELTGALIENLVVRHVFSSEGIVRLNYCDNSTIANSSFNDSLGTMFQLGDDSFLGRGCQNITLRDSVIVNGTQFGIYVRSSVDTTISGVTIEERGGSSGRGIQIDHATRTSVQGCTISNCSHHGIYVNVNVYHLLVRDCVISNNGEFANQYGVYITTGIENVTVVNNTFTDNNGAGPIYDASHVQAYDGGNNNAWNDSSGGNRWSDWLGPDADYDGFVDVAYDIDGAAGAQDMLPIADPETIAPEVVITAPVNGAVLASTDVTVEWSAWDNQTGLDRIEVTVDSDAPVNVGLNTSVDLVLTEGDHTVTVMAYDTVGNDGSDSVSFSIILPTVPGAPSGLVAVPSDSSTTLSWTAPDDGGSPITIYHVHRGGDAVNLTEIDTTDQLHYTDNGLVNGNTYYYAISAENAVGEGARSASVPATPANVPAAPLNPTASVNGTSVELSWGEPDDNGSAILHYNIYRGTTGDLVKVGESSGLTYVDEGLNGDTTYRYQVSAVNAMGEGTKSVEVQATVVVVPGPPQDLELSLQNYQIELSWEVPLSDGGSPIAQYNIYRGLSAGSLSLVGNSTALFFNDTGAPVGYTLYYAISAVNAIGEGDMSEVRNITFITVPGAPQDLTAEANNTGILLSWSAPDNDGGATVTGFRIYYGEGPGPLDQNVSVTSLEHLFDDIQPGVTYYFRVVAINGLGLGESTGIVNATFFTTPSAPNGLGAAEAEDGISLTWSAPSEDGGTEISGYNVYRSVGDGELVLLTTVEGTSYLDTDVQSDTTYNYVIKAVNDNGEGESSTQYSITFDPAEPDDGDGGIPWYFIVIPIVGIVVLLLLLFLLGKRNKEKKKEEKEGGQE